MNFFKSNIFSRVFKINITSNNKEINPNPNFTIQHRKILQDNLKQLEFISCFEMYLDKKNEDSYPLNFLQELASIRHSAQINIIESINIIKVKKQFPFIDT